MTPPAPLRYATAEDLPALAALEIACNPHPWSQNQLQAALNAGNALWLLPHAQYGVAAMLVWQEMVDEAEILLLDTHPDCRRRGHARQLLAALQQHARAAAWTRLLLEVRAGNEAALALYRQCGFKECGRRRAYYADNGEDAVLMECLC
ncbi:ribosomal-protein-alanine N-acetyltransferase [Neisseria sp. HSC-16F19]|nr:ribosomal protein S18-alanine N-acetyltransferase [Neisseria sp. HSC-16F19]MCP2040868.1 ribosomal-protein-alanine N-acetyltransferase [Neisseria sp. HSC-16F19]